MLSRKADTEFTFDVDLALKQNDENPVFYVQYAHARICSVLEQYAAQGGDESTLAGADLGRLVAASETALLRTPARTPRRRSSARTSWFSAKGESRSYAPISSRSLSPSSARSKRRAA